MAGRILARFGRLAVVPTAVAAATLAPGAVPPRCDPTVPTQQWDELFKLEQEQPIAGKTALVTGCSSGIGKSTACMLATAGCNLVLLARRQDKLEELRQEILKRQPSCQVTVIAGDVCSDSRKLELDTLFIFMSGLPWSPQFPSPCNNPAFEPRPQSTRRSKRSASLSAWTFWWPMPAWRWVRI